MLYRIYIFHGGESLNCDFCVNLEIPVMAKKYKTDYLYYCTVHFEDSLSITHQRMH
jgi:pyruvate-formate lyase-activating enzyme